MSVEGTLRRVGRYDILREIGRGGMAVVYLARQLDLDREVALKELSAFHASDPAFLERFLRESRVAGSLSHPNVVTVFEYFEHDGTPYISMEYLPRGSLRPLVGRLTLTQVAGVLEGLLGGLSHAETRSIVHRDLKPENVMLTSDGRVKIADFGIAKALNQAATARFLTATGTTIGTPTYMAPEQAMAKEIGPWTDLYSVGVMAYEMLVGRVPFHDTDTPMAILLRHVNDPIPSPLSVKPDLEPALAEWLERMLAKAPADRPQRAIGAWEDLEEIVISVLGPRWRREARLVDFATAVEPPKPLTPTPFHEESGHAPSVEDEADFRTFVAKGALGARPSAPEEPELDSAPPPSPSTEEPGIAGPPPGESEPAGPFLGVSPADEFRTYRPRRVQPEAAAPPPLQAPPPPQEAAPRAQDAPPRTEPPDLPSPRIEPPPREEPHRAIEYPAEADERELAPTLAPKARRATSFQWPVPAYGRRARRLWPIALAAALAAVGAAVAAIVLAGGEESTTQAPPPPKAPRPDVPLKPSDYASLAVSGPSVYLADPQGHVVRLDRQTLRAEVSIANAAAPRSVAVSGGLVYVADEGTLVTVRPDSLAPVSGSTLGRSPVLAGGGTAPLAAAATTGDGRGRLCIVETSGLGPCVDLDFAPSGVGVAGADDIFVASSNAGAVVPFRLRGGTLAAGEPIPVGKRPHGKLLALQERLYVPVERGVAVVDLRARRLSRRLQLPTMPAEIWIVPFTGRLFATLPSTDEVAVLDTAAPTRAPRLVSVGKRPVAIAGAVRPGGLGEHVFVANTGDDTISRLDARTGKLVGSESLTGISSTAARAIVSEVVFEEKGASVAVTIQLASGQLARHSLVVRDGSLSDGTATVELWQGGIASRIGRRAIPGLALVIRPKAGRIVIRLSAARDAFAGLDLQLGPGGRTALLELRKRPKPQPESSQGGGRRVLPQPKPKEPDVEIG